MTGLPTPQPRKLHDSVAKGWQKTLFQFLSQACCSHYLWLIEDL